MRSFTLLFMTIALLLASTSAQAGSRTRKKQNKLNEKAVEAMVEGDYEKAIELLQQSLELGELNITYLNLGRAYAKSGRCAEALSAYDRMAVAPRVDSPPAEDLYKILVSYREQLLEQCDGSIIIRCNPSQLTIQIDDQPEQSCPDAILSLPPGAHSFTLLKEGVVLDQKSADIVGMSTTYVDLDGTIKLAELEGPSELTPIAPREDSSLLATAGWGALSAGSALLVTSLIVELAVITPNIDEFDDAVTSYDARKASGLKSAIEAEQDANSIILALGGVTFAAGAGILAYHYLFSAPEDEQVTITLNPMGGIGLSARF